MDKKVLRASFKITSNVFLFVGLLCMVLTVWLEHYYLAIGTILTAVLGILVSLFSNEKANLKDFLKDLNVYFFIVVILVCLSLVLANKILFYVGMVLFILMIVLYLIPLFVTEKEETKKSKKGKKK